MLSEKFLADSSHVYLYVGFSIICAVIGAFGFLQLPEERTHF